VSRNVLAVVRCYAENLEGKKIVRETASLSFSKGSQTGLDLSAVPRAS
jgi:hypothetical protein